MKILRSIFSHCLFAAIVLLVHANVTVFVSPPGLTSGGKTVIMTRGDHMDFLDSPEALCARFTGQANWPCGVFVERAIANRFEILELPYNEWLHRLAGGMK